MIYLEKENSLTFSSQTHLRTDENMFRLDTTSSNDVNARYTVTTGETSEGSVDDSNKKVQYICIRYHSRFFDCLGHPNLNVTLATDKKMILKLSSYLLPKFSRVPFNIHCC